MRALVLDAGAFIAVDPRRGSQPSPEGGGPGRPSRETDIRPLPAGPTWVGTGRRIAAVLALALLDAGCGSDDVRSPTAPTDPDPVARTLVGIEIVNAPPAGLTVGYTVRLEVHGTYSDGTKRIEVAAWTSSAPAVASVDAGGAVRAHAAGVSTITATVGDLRATTTVEVRPAGPDETFWRQFAFNDHECRTRITCEEFGFEYRDLAERVLWRLLDLAGNELSGPIPPELGRLTDLERLSLRNNRLSGAIPVELDNLTALTDLSIDSGTGLCLPPEIQDTVFGQLAALHNDVPLCDVVTAFPPAALWMLALVLVVLGLRRNGVERQPAA